MKKKIFVCLAAFALALSLCACGVGGSQNAGFSTNRWGDDMETVLAALDDEQVLTLGDVLIVTGTEVEGLTVNAIYVVDGDKGLQSISYMSDELSDPIAAYKSLQQAITRSYGKPEEDGVETLNQNADSISEEQALKNGYAMYKTNWTTSAETIRMAMGSGDDGEVALMCVFTAAGAAQD